MKVLVVEDKSDSRSLIRRMLEIYGHDVIEAENGEVAVKRYFEDTPDVILMDIAMPVMNGVEAARKIRQHEEGREQPQHVPIICVTAYGDQFAERALAAGCDVLLNKPIDFRRLDPILAHYSRTD